MKKIVALVVLGVCPYLQAMEFEDVFRYREAMEEVKPVAAPTPEPVPVVEPPKAEVPPAIEISRPVPPPALLPVIVPPPTELPPVEVPKPVPAPSPVRPAAPELPSVVEAPVSPQEMISDELRVKEQTSRAMINQLQRDLPTILSLPSEEKDRQLWQSLQTIPMLRREFMDMTPRSVAEVRVIQSILRDLRNVARMLQSHMDVRLVRHGARGPFIKKPVRALPEPPKRWKRQGARGDIRLR